MLSGLREETAQGLTEYALLILFVAIALVLIVTLFGQSLGDTYSQIITKLPF